VPGSTFPTFRCTRSRSAASARCWRSEHLRAPRSCPQQALPPSGPPPQISSRQKRSTFAAIRLPLKPAAQAIYWRARAPAPDTRNHRAIPFSAFRQPARCRCGPRARRRGSSGLSGWPLTGFHASVDHVAQQGHALQLGLVLRAIFRKVLAACGWHMSHPNTVTQATASEEFQHK
jgi:hypothetical protein